MVKSWWMLPGVGLAALAVVGAALLFRPAPPPPPVPPAPPPKPVNVKKIMDDGTLTRPSPEDEFLAAAARMDPQPPLKVDLTVARAEAQRVFGGLRDHFRKMKALADSLKKSNPQLYAKEVEALKEELGRLIQASRTLFKESDVALEELVKILQGEGDPVVKERLGFLLKLAPPQKSTPVILALAQSADAGDRRAAIGALVELRSTDSMKALVDRASADTEMDVRERAIVGIGKSLSQPSPAMSGDARDSAMDAIRNYTRADQPVAVRAAAWDAFSYAPHLGESDRDLLQKALHAEKDSYVIKKVENAYRHQSVRSKSEADATRQK